MELREDLRDSGLFSINKRRGAWKGFVPRRAPRVLLGLNPSFSLILLNPEEGFPGGSDGKESTHNAGDPGLSPESDPWVWKIP